MNKNKLIIGSLLIIVGLLFLGNSLSIFMFSIGDFFNTIFPIILILLGFYLIDKKRRSTTVKTETAQATETFTTTINDPSGKVSITINREEQQPEEPEQADNEHSTNTLRYSKTMGDMFIDCDGKNLQSVEVSNVIGDLEIKLHGGKLKSGLNRLIISGFIGDTRILAPKDMPIFVQASSFIGDIELFSNRVGGFGNNIDAQTPDYTEADAKLYIATNSFIGDIRVYYV